ncbi:hypothetical protein GLT81_00440 [Nanohaloarchaea archaeon]|nr:hypothetical protein [Candidatus Nanohaloarchaea archaeon]
MTKHNISSKKLHSDVTQDQMDEARNLPQVIKELVTAQPDLVQSIPDETVKNEVQRLRKLAEEEGAKV